MSKIHRTQTFWDVKVTIVIASLVCVVATLVVSPVVVSPAVHAQPGCTPPKNPFQLVAQQFSQNAPPNDVNGFLLNPQWQWQVSCPPSMEGGEPRPILDNYPDSIDSEICRNAEFADCTGEVKQTTFDGVGICPMCNLGHKRKNRKLGHVNWFTVTYTGDICFHNTSYPDMDYTFSLRPKMGAGLTRWNHPSKPDSDGKPIDPTKLPQAIHVEFDSRETVNLFRSNIWSQFRNDASPCRWWDFRNPCDMDAAMNRISRRRAVVIGLMGLDSEHEIYSESHPVYAMAIEVNDSLHDNTWIVFARNTGTEGNCSQLKHPLNSPDGQLVETLRLLIPPPDGAKVTAVSARTTQFFSNNDICPQLGYYTNDQYSEDNEGVLITFNLQSCPQRDCDPLVEGEIHLDWSVQGTPIVKSQAEIVDRCLVMDEEEQAEESRKYKDPSPTQAVRLMQLLQEERAAGARSMNRCQSLANGPIPRVQITEQHKNIQTESVLTTAATAENEKRKAQEHFKKISNILFPH
jgi:hypothetical protein